VNGSLPYSIRLEGGALQDMRSMNQLHRDFVNRLLGDLAQGSEPGTVFSEDMLGRDVAISIRYQVNEATQEVVAHLVYVEDSVEGDGPG
jgi:hypothetical protein